MGTAGRERPSTPTFRHALPGVLENVFHGIGQEPVRPDHFAIPDWETGVGQQQSWDRVYVQTLKRLNHCARAYLASRLFDVHSPRTSSRSAQFWSICRSSPLRTEAGQFSL